VIDRLPHNTKRRATSALYLVLTFASAPAGADEILPLPLSGAAYRVADQAYREYASGDYDAALRDAREAVRQRPDVPSLRGLLRQAEAAVRNRARRPATGRAPPANSRATAHAAVSPAPVQGARALVSRALDLLGQNKLVDASREIDRAVQLAPDVPQYRLLQVYVSIRLQDYAAAESASRAESGNVSGDALMSLMSGYLLQRRGSYDAAREQYVRALSATTPGNVDPRILRLAVADAALSAGDAQGALDALKSLEDSDADARERKLYAQALAADNTAPRLELKAPVIQCAMNQAALVCALTPLERPSHALADAAYRAAADHRLQEAVGLFDMALRVGGANRELEGRRDSVRRQMAQQPAGLAYRAMADNDPESAQKQIALAIAYAPDVMAYRLLRIEALERMHQNAAAESAASEAMQADDEDSVPVLMRGYLRQLQGRPAAALGDYQRALKNDTLSDDDLRNLRLYVADASMAGGDFKFATQTLSPLPTGDKEAAWRRTLMSFYRQYSGHSRLRAPFLDCRLTPYGTVCTARPADSATDAMIEAIYKALAKKHNSTALALARDLVALSPKNERYRWVLAQALTADGRASEANEVFASLHDATPDVDLAYLASMSGASALATQTFKKIDDADKLPAGALQDAGFAAVNADQRPAAVTYFKRSIDAVGDGQLEMSPQSLYETRRAVSELERQWGAYVSLSYRGSNNMQAGQNQSALVGDNLQIGTEAYWRPPSLDRDGSYVDLYARLTDTAYSAPTTSSNTLTGDTFVGKSPTGVPSLLSAFGVRWKPLASQNIIIAFERQQAIGSAAQSDWLPRLGYSYGLGTDLRADVPSWNTHQVYAETGYYLRAQTYYFTSELQSGRSFRLPETWLGNTVVWPHAVLGADYNNAYSMPWAVGAGVGVNLRHWFREDRYHAPRSYFDLSVQYRLKVAGDERAKGWFIRSVFNY
jgi:tetratricopeptide (TPR) repeat protein